MHPIGPGQIGFTSGQKGLHDGSTELFDETRSAIIAVPLNNSREVNWTLATAGWDPRPWLMQIELTNIAAGIDCEATRPKLVQITVP